ncbi:MAG: PepSY domain-containing protein [Hyphomicrobiales bacterium]|nr:MAG: PepSY domain-containing protein [Hyphomicrobiales bacterium]
MRKIVLATVAAFTVIGSTAAFASGDEAKCTSAPRDQWMSEEAVKAKVMEMGYEVRRVKVEDGCYEAYAIDKNGAKAELYVDPMTGNVVKSKMDD